MFCKKWRVLLLSSLFFLLVVNISWAVEFPFLNKSKIRLVIAPGETKYDEIVIENPHPEAKLMRVYLEDWRYLPGGDGSKEFSPVSSNPLSCASWINFSPAEFTVPAFGKQRLSYSVKMPSNAQGAYYAVIFFETKYAPIAEQQTELGAGINLALRTAVLLYVEAKDTIKRSVQLSNFSIRKEDKKLIISLDLTNDGNTDITTKSQFNISDEKDNVYARGEFNDTYTFAGDKAELIASWKEAMPKGKYHLVTTFDLGKALKDANMGSGPAIVRETDFEIDENGEVLNVGEMK